jgi:phenylalanyl-tRNA synthetase beta chain
MTISYHWLQTYMPVTLTPDETSQILTSIGLEVEQMQSYASVPGGLQGLLVGEVIACSKHPDADRLSLTRVDVGNDRILSIVCGAPNVAVGQKVIVAPVGTTIYPLQGEPVSMKQAKIRGQLSEGMICAEDEVGLGESHDGILVLPASSVPGTPVASLFEVYEDVVFEIGLTPNRSDAMSHWGVARDLCAYLSHHRNETIRPKRPASELAETNAVSAIQIDLKDASICARYAGLTIDNVTISESPSWLKHRLQSIGLKPVNNLVDITNFVLHETGQPLHAFDANTIAGQTVIIRSAEPGETLVTLDGKKRDLQPSDIVIEDTEKLLCLAGIYGGLTSGVTAETKTVFLESAQFNRSRIRMSGLAHELRTDASSRFEKGTDIGLVPVALARAAQLITEICGGTLRGCINDIYPEPLPAVTIRFGTEYLSGISGKAYSADQTNGILTALGFECTPISDHEWTVTVPSYKNDIRIPADLAEEIMRIDGLDNIPIPDTISIAPSIEKNGRVFRWKQKIHGLLNGWGFRELFTNSITDAALYTEEQQRTGIKMINSLSAEMNMMRPDMLYSGLSVIRHNLNRQQSDFRLYEFGKIYSTDPEGHFREEEQLVLFLCGNDHEPHWRTKPVATDFYTLKGFVSGLLETSGIKTVFEPAVDDRFQQMGVFRQGARVLAECGVVSPAILKKADIKVPVYFACLHSEQLMRLPEKTIRYREISRFPAVERDLALVVDKNVSYSQLEQIALSCKIKPLAAIGLFDVFEHEKLGVHKKSLALRFTFTDDEKTLTDQQVDGFVQSLIQAYEKQTQAQIRK